jgi:stearoyl-CoA desaturase (delta-9 desaturase)
LTTAMVTREWVAVHRMHHAKCETEEDPHSPRVDGIWKVLLVGVGLYHAATRDAETLEHLWQRDARRLAGAARL